MLDDDFVKWIIGNMKIKHIARLRQKYEQEVKPDPISEAAQRFTDAIAQVLGDVAAVGFTLIDQGWEADEQALYDELEKNGIQNIT